MRSLLTLVVLCVLPCVVTAQTSPAAQAGRKWRQAHEHAIIEEFVSLLSIPNIARDRENIQRNAQAIARMLEKRSIPAKLIAVPGSNPMVFDEIRTPGATRTIVFYAHYDGQPLDPKEWSSPPFEPTLRDGPVESGGRIIPLAAVGTLFQPESRMYARSAADDKAPIVAILAAVDAIRAAGLTMRSNIKFAFEGEEESGSPNLEKILAANKDLFSGDVWLMCDGPVHQTRRQSIVFGARTVVTLDLTVYGPRSELHSGHYGNWAPNPALTLARLLTSMKDDSGRVLVERFYADVEPLTDLERRSIAGAPNIDRQLMRETSIASTKTSGFRISGTASSSWLPCWRCDNRVEPVNAFEQRPRKPLRLVLSRAAGKQSLDQQPVGECRCVPMKPAGVRDRDVAGNVPGPLPRVPEGHAAVLHAGHELRRLDSNPSTSHRPRVTTFAPHFPIEPPQSLRT